MYRNHDEEITTAVEAHAAEKARAAAIPSTVQLAYCDYIAHEIKEALGLASYDAQCLIASAGPVKWDLHPIGGYMMSTKKTILVTDRNGKEYRVTVEEAVAPVAELPVERLIFEAKSKVHELNQRDLYSQDTFDEELMAECLRLCRGDKLKAQLLASVVREL